MAVALLAARPYPGIDLMDRLKAKKAALGKPRRREKRSCQLIEDAGFENDNQQHEQNEHECGTVCCARSSTNIAHDITPL